MIKTLQAQHVILPDGSIQPAQIDIADGVIQQVRLTDFVAADEVIADDAVVAPGLIDIFVHGAQGADTMDATDAALSTIGKALLSEGVTSYLATTMTQSASAIAAAVATAGHYQSPADEAQLLGIHLEGPFVHPDKMGAQDGAAIQLPDVTLFDEWQNLSGGRIKVATFAPERDGGMALAQHLHDSGVVAAIGHSTATMQQTQQAIEQGVSLATHLYNAMTGLDHRQPGVVPAILANPQVMAQLIVDGVHIHPDVVKFTYEIMGAQRIILASDAMRGKGMVPGKYDLGGQMVQVTEHEARLVSNGALAGSVLRMDEAVRLMMRYSGCGLAQAVQMASANPAKCLGLQHKGVLAPGADADLIVFDSKFKVTMSVCRGHIAFRA